MHEDMEERQVLVNLPPTSTFFFLSLTLLHIAKVV